MPLRKLTSIKGKHLSGAIVLALALYLFPQICMAACPMMAPAMENCCCDHQKDSQNADRIAAANCCEVKQATAKDDSFVVFKSVSVPFLTQTTSDLDFSLVSYRSSESELPVSLMRLAQKTPVLRI